MTTPPESLKKRALRVFLPVFVLIFAALGGLTLVKHFLGEGSHHSGHEIAPGTVLPDFVLHRFGGGKFPISRLKGEVVLINFWATWCEACLVEIPSIIKLREAYLDKGFDVVFISLDENPDAVLPKTLSRLKMTFPTYVDTDQRLSELFNVHGIPLTVLINRKREILYTYPGEKDWNSPSVRKKMDRWLNL